MRKRFNLQFECEYAAFDGEDCSHETARILRKAADQVEQGAEFGNIKDVNGNTVGDFSFSE